MPVAYNRLTDIENVPSTESPGGNIAAVAVFGEPLGNGAIPGST